MRPNHAAKKGIKAEASAIRDILNAWDPISGSPTDEYDCLVDHIVSALHAGRTSPKDIASLIASELNGHFGITEPEQEVAKVAISIAEYWNRHSR